MRKTIAAAALAASGLMLTACRGDDTTDRAANSDTSATASTTAKPTPTRTSTPTPPPAPDRDGDGKPDSIDPYPDDATNTPPDPRKALGEAVTSSNGAMTITVFGFNPHVAPTGPQPADAQMPANFVWTALDAQVCGSATAAPETAILSTAGWEIKTADNAGYDTSNVGYRNFPQPEFPFGERWLSPGECVRGLMVFPLPAGAPVTEVRADFDWLGLVGVWRLA